MEDNEYCTPEEQQQRVDICKECPRFRVYEGDDKTYCLEEKKSISFMITDKQTNCPLGKW